MEGYNVEKVKLFFVVLGIGVFCLTLGFLFGAGYTNTGWTERYNQISAEYQGRERESAERVESLEKELERYDAEQRAIIDGISDISGRNISEAERIIAIAQFLIEAYSNHGEDPNSPVGGDSD